MTLRLLQAPVAPTLLLEEAKDNLEVLHDEDDAKLDSAIAAVTAHVDGAAGWLNRALITQRWQLELDGDFPADSINLPLPPLISVESVRYLDAAGDEQTVDPAIYRVRTGEGGRVRLKPGRCWPDAIEIYVAFTCGYGDSSDDIPRPIRQGLLLLVGDLHANRETSVTGTISSEIKMTASAENLLGLFRSWHS